MPLPISSATSSGQKPAHIQRYLHWDEKTVTDFSPEHIHGLYEQGYLFTRKGRGIMHQTRSVRIDLAKFELTSENRRILKKTESAVAKPITSVIPFANYSWSIAKMAKDFYDKKFGPGVMSANKIRELMTDTYESSFNTLLEYAESGYCIAYRTPAMLHYSYPFYDTDAVEKGTLPKDAGLGMMIRAVVDAKEKNLSHMYLGSLQRPGDVYKLQFRGMEWFDGKTWQTDLDTAKEILKNPPQDRNNEEYE